MKKTWIMLLAAFALVLAACSDAETSEPEDVKEKDSHVEDKIMEEKADDVSEADKDTETEVEKKDSEETEESDEAEGSTADTKEEGLDEPEEDKTEEIDIVEFGFEIFEAQANEDYDFIESVLSKGSSVDRENNIIRFENVTYPHDYEFISKRDFQSLNKTFIQDPDDEIIMGFDVTDYENESSYVIETQFIQEDGKWKLNDMDVNK